MIDLGKAIKAINKTANFIITDENVDTIEWINNTTPIAKEDILAKQVELQAEYDALEYSRNREKEYPTWQDQLDDIYHNGVDGWKATIKVTKDKYPKP